MKLLTGLLVLSMLGACSADRLNGDQKTRKLIGPVDAYMVHISSPDRNMPPFNWRDGFPDPGKWDDPYIFNWTHARIRQGWIAIRPRQQEEYNEALLTIREAEKQNKIDNERLERESDKLRSRWSIHVNDNTPPKNWREVTPKWIDDPQHVDWAAFRLEHGWLLDDATDE